jgi:Phage integrase family
MENSRLRKAPSTSINVTVANRSREYLTDREVERLIEAAKQNRSGHRDATAILVAYRHGLRASELVALRWDDIDLATGRLQAGMPACIRYRRGKAGRCARASASTALLGSWAFPTAQCSELLRSCKALSSPREASPLSGRAWDLPLRRLRPVRELLIFVTIRRRQLLGRHALDVALAVGHHDDAGKSDLCAQSAVRIGGL